MCTHIHTHAIRSTGIQEHCQKILLLLALISGRMAEGCHIYLRNYLMTHKNLSVQTRAPSLAKHLCTIKGLLSGQPTTAEILAVDIWMKRIKGFVGGKKWIARDLCSPCCSPLPLKKNTQNVHMLLKRSVRSSSCSKVTLNVCDSFFQECFNSWVSLNMDIVHRYVITGIQTSPKLVCISVLSLLQPSSFITRETSFSHKHRGKFTQLNPYTSSPGKPSYLSSFLSSAPFGTMQKVYCCKHSFPQV